MLDVMEWLAGLAQDTATHHLYALAALGLLGILAAITLPAQNLWWALHDRYSRYGIRRDPPPPPR